MTSGDNPPKGLLKKARELGKKQRAKETATKQYSGEHGCRTFLKDKNRVCMAPETVVIDGRMYCDVHRPVEAWFTLQERINPSRFNFSPKMTALVGAILHVDYGVRDGRGGLLTSLSITSDGFVVCGSTAHESGAFIGTAEELHDNLSLWLAGLSEDDQKTFWTIYNANVKDWRK